MNQKHSSLLLLIVLASIQLVVSSGRGQSSQSAPSAAQAASPGFLRDPIGAARCQGCHSSEVEGYARSAMAHSLRIAGQEPEGEVGTPDGKITMHSSSTGYWQSLQSGGDISDYRIDYVIGSGNHASGYLLNVGGHLFQSPVAYYKSRHSYDLAPGYEGVANPDFTRPIAEGCLFCHSGAALKVSGTANQYHSPPFDGEAITCERCHGPAEKHLSDPRAGTIVNPAKLEPAARDSICEQCHLLGVGRVLNPGMKFSDFRPGEPLEDVFTTYRNVSTAGEKFKVISHVEQLARSSCARKSNGRLWCGTCHDPHNEPLDPVQFFRGKCLSCHIGNFPASHPDKESNCTGCHMPRRDAKDGGHTAFTDHRIQRRPEQEESLPSDADIAAWREPAPELQKRNLGIAYISVGMERRSREFIGRGYRMLTEVQNQFAGDSEIFTSMGSALLLAKQTPEAELAFERALQLKPGSVTGETNAASAYLQAGDRDKAVTHLERAVAIDPLHLPAVAPLIQLYKEQGNAAGAAELSAKVSTAMGQRSAQDANIIKADSPVSPQSAELVFKNLQVLKGVPSDQVIPAMRFITASLGVECSYCHVPEHFEKDDKKPKVIARQMMRMLVAIDGKDFGGNREVTCYSCHQGSPKPNPIPEVAFGPLRQSTTNQLPRKLPTADELIDNYVRALGGAEAIERITSREETGATTVGGKTFRIEFLKQVPSKEVLIRHTPTGDAVTVFNGHEGWSSIPGQPVRNLQGSDLDAAQIEADLRFPLHIKQRFAELRVDYPEKIGDREAYVVSCVDVGQPPVKLYFDEASGLLIRLVRYISSPLGLVPVQVDYADYRDIDPVKVPFRRTVAEPDGRMTTQLERIENNIAIDGSKFLKPIAQNPRN